MSTPAELLQQSLTALRNAKRFSAATQSYRRDNPGEYAKVIAYLDGGTRPTGTLTEMGSHAVVEEDARRALVIPIPPAQGYFNEDFTNISLPQWDSVQTYYGSGAFNPGPSPGVQSDPSGRLALVTAPDGVGRALRFEIRNEDPPWPPQLPTQVQRSQLGAPTQAIWNAATMTLGDIRWFDFEMWLPNEFDWGREEWNAMIGIHPSGSTGWGAFNIVIEPYGNPHPHYIQFKLGGGSPAGTSANLKFYNLIQLTNADGSIYAPNRNRRIHLRYGGKFNPDNTGWAEAWVDGVNVLPRISRPTCWADDFHQYMKLGPYKPKATAYPSGKTVVYFTRVSIGY